MDFFTFGSFICTKCSLPVGDTENMLCNIELTNGDTVISISFPAEPASEHETIGTYEKRMIEIALRSLKYAST